LEPELARRAGHGQAVPGKASVLTRLTDERGLIALAEPVPDSSLLKPIVGFRSK
jgi:hypothetical protein